MTNFVVGAVCYDWFTLVSNEPEFYKYWRDEQASSGCEVNEERWLKRFDGYAQNRKYGTLFVGSRRELVGVLSVAVITGNLAQELADKVRVSLDLHQAWLTRVDIQTTLEQDGLDLVQLFNRLENGRKRPEILGDRENGRTVYIGSRKSERFARVYQKFADGRKPFLRCEFQFSGQQARSYGRALGQGTITKESAFRGALQQTKDDILIKKYLTAVDGFDPQLPRVVRGESKTDAWLVDTVYPVVMRRLLAHDCPPIILELFGALKNDNP